MTTYSAKEMAIKRAGERKSWTKLEKGGLE